MKISKTQKKGVDYIGITCVFFCHDGKGKFLLHKRSNKCRDEVGNWDCGGGALEFGESFEDAVRREIKEEYSCEVEDLQFLKVNNVLRKNGNEKTHWVALIYAAKVNPKKVKIGDKQKMDEINWFYPDKWPNPLHSKLIPHFEFVKERHIHERG